MIYSPPGQADAKMKYKAQYELDYYNELNRANLLEESNYMLHCMATDLEDQNKKLYVEVDALKAQYFPNQSKEVA